MRLQRYNEASASAPTSVSSRMVSEERDLQLSDVVSSLLYVSRSTVPASGLAKELADIQYTSLARNSECDLTGVLIATPVFFAQILEGPIGSLTGVMRSIRADARHVEIDEDGPNGLEGRSFRHWSMACFGPDSFTSRQIEPAIMRCHGSMSPRKAVELISFIKTIIPAGKQPSTF
ncbi:BLUF domain-containing protein [Sphingomonas sp. MMS24-J13]|uniref:BLUF domain-containing protein n=1 Tax=Sphingomonas sp. MMS24-J13 TaxID=3238686 RepID=UPI0038507550